jgi:uncharacterized protein (TIGR02453 family)
MLQLSTIKFLSDLKKNNNKPWFETNRKMYESAKADFASFVESIIKATATFDEPIGILKAKDCMFRINRDVRFSKDKSPYKSNMGASFSHGGKKASVAGYYFHCEPEQSFAAGGFYMPSAPELAKIRQEIDYNFGDWLKIVENKNFIKHFPNGVDGTDVLVRPPKGYEENNIAISFLKMKGFTVSEPIADSELTDKKIVQKIAASFTAMKPMIDFLNRAAE